MEWSGGLEVRAGQLSTDREGVSLSGKCHTLGIPTEETLGGTWSPQLEPDRESLQSDRAASGFAVFNLWP